jgi:hypothetical protein
MTDRPDPRTSRGSVKIIRTDYDAVTIPAPTVRPRDLTAGTHGTVTARRWVEFRNGCQWGHGRHSTCRHPVCSKCGPQRDMAACGHLRKLASAAEWTTVDL